MKIINRLEEEAKKFWILFYIDLDKNTFNPGVQISDWKVVQEIERMTCQLQKEGRNVRICTTKTVYDERDLMSQSEIISSWSKKAKYDPFLMW